MKRFYVLLFTCLCSSALVKGQTAKTTLITVDAQSVNIEEFIKQVEQQSDYIFYYNPAQFDSFSVNVIAKQLPLTEILKFVFRNTDFFASIDSNNHVFLTKGQAILIELPSAANTRRNDSLRRAGHLFNNKELNAQNNFADNKLIQIGIKTNVIKPGSATLSGYVLSYKTNEPLHNAIISEENGHVLARTDSNGYYKISLPKGRNNLVIKSFGKKTARRQLMMYADGSLNIEPQDEIRVLEDVLVSTQRSINVNKPQMGVERLNIKAIKNVPTVFGEADVMRVILTLPGVKSVGEASTGFNVRGGSADQNLILFNDGTIYNPSHFFGFFSAFNPELVKDVELYKSSIPAQFGGRLSSVLDITGREGNKEKFAGSAGIGLLTSRVNIEGPIQKGKSSFNIGGRTTYSNWLLKLLPERSSYRNSAASFYDVNMLLSQKVNDRNDLSLTGYLSKDNFNLNSDTVYGYSNNSLSGKWRHVFNNQMEATFTAAYDRYTYENTSVKNKVNAYKMAFDINQLNLKSHFTYTLSKTHLLDFGASSIYYKLHPGSFTPVAAESLVIPDILQAEQALESAVYVSDRVDIGPKFSVSTGLRYSMFNYLGANNVNVYVPDLPIDESSFIKTEPYKDGQFIKTYKGPEVRASGRYSITKSFSMKASYNTLRQYIHMLSNTTSISPTDIWKLSDPNIKPQFGDQVSFGLFKNFKTDSIEMSAEVYYKRLKNYLDYKSGAQLVLNPHIETDVINTKGKAYGVEFMVKKKAGKLNGWLSYTYSRTLLRMNDSSAGTIINNGNFYPSNYDKPHDATLVGNYAINQRFSISLNVNYSTGRPITLPIGRYYYGGSQRALYSDRNAYRIPDYFRTDFSMNIEGNHKVHQFWHNSWTIGIYNFTARRNPYSVYFTSENGVVNGYKLSIFGNAIPFINFNVRF